MELDTFCLLVIDQYILHIFFQELCQNCQGYHAFILHNYPFYAVDIRNQVIKIKSALS